LWDRCINTSERTKSEVDLSQRYPMPYRQALFDHARTAGLDPAYVYGLIRQESRFLSDVRSGVGAAGLMQLMPTTASWSAKKIGMMFHQSMITEVDVNLRLGTYYLQQVLNDLSGSQAMAAAAYNAGPNRPRKWREAPTIEAAIWVESIPFSETRDYVKKVLANAVFYGALLDAAKPSGLSSLKARLGKTIGPRASEAAAMNTQLP
jgi:soluble lytic murein transglycosylase